MLNAGAKESSCVGEDEHLTAEEAGVYAPILLESYFQGKGRGTHPYETDADEVYVDAGGSGRDGVAFTVWIASLYTIFNDSFLREKGISCIVNMAGCEGAKEHYQKDMQYYPSRMHGVPEVCGKNLGILFDDGEAAFKEYYHKEYGIRWMSLEGVQDNWYYPVGQHFQEVSTFLDAHLQEMVGRKANILINCYGGLQRSTAVAIAFLLRRTGKSLATIIGEVAPRRPGVLVRHKWSPNRVQSNFLRQLIRFEAGEAAGKSETHLARAAPSWRLDSREAVAGAKEGSCVAEDEHLTAEEAGVYAPLLLQSCFRGKGRRSHPYETDADEVYVDAGGSGRDGVAFTVWIASLYTIFNGACLREKGISCIVNMAGCEGAKEHYQKDMQYFPSRMHGVQEVCGKNLGILFDDGEAAFKEYYHKEYGIRWMSLEGVQDNWYYPVGRHFQEVSTFLDAHLQEMVGRRANILINCYGGLQRSTAVAIAFLLRRTGKSLATIIGEVAPRRPGVLVRRKWTPNRVQSNFLKQLILFEATGMSEKEGGSHGQ